MYKISKSVDCCYGHRVWSQVLDKPDLSISTECKCRHLHGHQGKITVVLSGNQLENGMVTDFHNLTFFKKFIDDYVDHKFIIDKQDPLFHRLLGSRYPRNTLSESSHFTIHDEGFYTPYLSSRDVLPIEEVEMLEGLIIVPFLPTSENLAAWFYKIVNNVMSKHGILVESVEFNETPKTSATYSETL